jgi:FkbM family methyltransferase
MAHTHPPYPFFTCEVTQRGILQEPFRLIDVGVRGGIGAHWKFFGDHLELWGIDPLYEGGVGPLIASNPHPDRFHYLNMGLGDADENRLFRFYPENPSSSHFEASNKTDRPYIDHLWREVPLRRLDTLFAEGQIQAADFMKMDAETYEIEIVKGGQQFFRSSGIFGIETESTFFRTRRNPRSHFVELYELLAAHGFNVFDAGIQRVSRSSLSRGFPQEISGGISLRPVGRAYVFDFLFLREEFEEHNLRASVSIDRLIKMIATAELYGLQDIGLDVLLASRDRLGVRLDVDEAANWLVREKQESRFSYPQYQAL